MAVANQEITDRYAVYMGDCIEVIRDVKSNSIHLTVYSPPFAELYNYSSSEHDLSNCSNYAEFLEHYEFLIREIARISMPGRISCVHCMDLRKPGSAVGMRDFPGDIIRLYERHRFTYLARHCIWKEPLRMAIKTRALGLRHAQLVKDSSKCHAANAEYLLVFRNAGENKIPIEHPNGLSVYHGARSVPQTLVEQFADKGGDNRTNRLSHWIWQRYASAFWDDIRVKHVLPFKGGRDSEDEKHICPLQLDVIERCITLYSNAGETILTPFMGVGSEVYVSITRRRKAIGIELKESYYKQALQNIHAAMNGEFAEQGGLFAHVQAESEDDDQEEIDESDIDYEGKWRSAQAPRNKAAKA